MTGFVVKRVRHVCVGRAGRWVQVPQGVTEADVPPCRLCAASVTKGGKGDLRYDCIWRAGGKQRSKTFLDKHAAERFLTSVVKETQEGTYTHVQPMLMDKVFDRWQSHSLMVRFNQGDLKPSTLKSYQSMLRAHLRPAFKDHRSDRLSSAAVSDWLRELATGIAEGSISPKSRNHLVVLFQAILNWAREPAQRFLSHDPLANVKLVRVSKLERRFLEPAELTALLEAAEAPVDTVLYLAVYSGLRRGELFALQWRDLDEKTNHLTVRRSNYQGAISTPKTAMSARTIDLPPPIVARLQDYRERYPPMKGDYIFRTETGTPIDPDNWFGRCFVPTAIKAKLRNASAPDDAEAVEQLVGLHTLRHTYASLLINQGESIKYVSKQLGHASINITADLYGHLFKETSVSAMNRLSMRIEGSSAGRGVVAIATGTNG